MSWKPPQRCQRAEHIISIDEVVPTLGYSAQEKDQPPLLLTGFLNTRLSTLQHPLLDERR